MATIETHSNIEMDLGQEFNVTCDVVGWPKPTAKWTHKAPDGTIKGRVI